MSKEVGAGGRFDIFLDSAICYPKQMDNVFVPKNIELFSVPQRPWSSSTNISRDLCKD